MQNGGLPLVHVKLNTDAEVSQQLSGSYHYFGV